MAIRFSVNMRRKRSSVGPQPYTLLQQFHEHKEIGTHKTSAIAFLFSKIDSIFPSRVRDLNLINSVA